MPPTGSTMSASRWTLHQSNPQDPEILDFYTNLEKASQLLLVGNHGLGLPGASSQSSRFTLGCKLARHTLAVLARQSQDGYITCQEQKRNLVVPKLDSLQSSDHTALKVGPQTSVQKHSPQDALKGEVEYFLQFHKTRGLIGPIPMNL